MTSARLVQMGDPRSWSKDVKQFTLALSVEAFKHVGGHGLLGRGCVRSLGAIGYNLGPDGETWHLWGNIGYLRLPAFLRLPVSLVIT